MTKSLLKSLCKSQLCWELQLLNVGKINPLSEVESPVISSDTVHHDIASKADKLQV